MISLDQINDYFGDIDLLLLDQLLKGNITKGPLLDAGTGDGRNLAYFVKEKYPIALLDNDQQKISVLKYLLGNDKSLALSFHVENVAQLPFPNATFQTVLCTRVFHFLQSQEIFIQAWNELKRVITPGGILFFTTNTNFGLDTKDLKERGDGRFLYPDGKEELLLTSELLYLIESDPSFEKVETFRFQNFENIRCEATLILRKL